MSAWPPDPTMPGPPPMGGPGPGMPPPGFPPDPGSGGFGPGSGGFDPSGGYDPSGGFGGPPPPPPGGGGLNPGLIIGLVVLVVAIVGGGAFLLLGGDDDDNGSENAANRRDRQGQEGSEDCPSVSLPPELEVPGPSSDGSASLRSQIPGGDGTSIPEGLEVPEIPEGCIPEMDTDITLPDETDLTVPTVPDVTIESDPVTPPSDSTSSGGGSDTLAESIYESTPVSIDEDTAYCIADVIVGVVGESEVESAGGTWDAVYNGTSPEQDSAIASGIYNGCTSPEQDADLAADDVWPDAWATG